MHAICVVCESSDSRGLCTGAQNPANTSGKELVRSGAAACCARYADGCLLELAAATGRWYEGKDVSTGTCVGMEVRECTGVEICRVGWQRHWANPIGVLSAVVLSALD